MQSPSAHSGLANGRWSLSDRILCGSQFVLEALVAAGCRDRDASSFRKHCIEDFDAPVACEKQAPCGR